MMQHEIKVAQRALKRCKWYEYGKRKVLRTYIKIMKSYE